MSVQRLGKYKGPHAVSQMIVEHPYYAAKSLRITTLEELLITVLPEYRDKLREAWKMAALKEIRAAAILRSGTGATQDDSTPPAAVGQLPLVAQAVLSTQEEAHQDRSQEAGT